MTAALLLALAKCLVLPLAGVVGYLSYLGWYLWRRPDLNDWADHS